MLKGVYEPFTDDELSAKIGEIVTPAHLKAEVEIVYQTVDNLHKACPQITKETGTSPEIIQPSWRKSGS
jgi:amidophosphoribosyltransferase